jgi:hypothetical protein
MQLTNISRDVVEDAKNNRSYIWDNFESIKQRHRNFHHFAKNLRESVDVFGTIYHNGNIKRMYHGIDKQMIFNNENKIIFIYFL